MSGRGRAIIDIMAVSTSGALSPGPLSFTAVAAGAYLGVFGGLLVATGHLLFELPFTLLLAHGFRRLGEAISRYRLGLDLAFIASALYFAYESFKAGMNPVNPTGGIVSSSISALLAGFLLTGLNAYFIAWWLTVGIPLVRVFSEAGALLRLGYYTAHVWIDYAWLTLLSTAGFLLSTRFYSYMLDTIGIVLVALAARHVHTIVNHFAENQG
uniref:Lysine exporter protein (LYSE/YGGA) n=1 Tax=Thermogladius calderae TaxID=1200300 RepID=A0A7J3XWX1_9CREN